MDYQEYISFGLNGEEPLKLILGGCIESAKDGKVGVVSVVYATNDKDMAEHKIQELIKANPGNYYMVYSVPLNTDLTTLDHYPSLVVTKEDLL
jgi:hypothetical protein